LLYAVSEKGKPVLLPVHAHSYWHAAVGWVHAVVAQ
jgi:hypothetical protein